MEEILARRLSRQNHHKKYLEYLIKWKYRGPKDAL